MIGRFSRCGRTHRGKTAIRDFPIRKPKRRESNATWPGLESNKFLLSELMGSSSYPLQAQSMVTGPRFAYLQATAERDKKTTTQMAQARVERATPVCDRIATEPRLSWPCHRQQQGRRATRVPSNNQLRKSRFRVDKLNAKARARVLAGQVRATPEIIGSHHLAITERSLRKLNRVQDGDGLESERVVDAGMVTPHEYLVEIVQYLYGFGMVVLGVHETKEKKEIEKGKRTRKKGRVSKTDTQLLPDYEKLRETPDTGWGPSFDPRGLSQEGCKAERYQNSELVCKILAKSEVFFVIEESLNDKEEARVGLGG
ncbi:hypothetical protein B0H12DRAFT_1078581 [Mycena haematopus]|nr:hypothetical protein B0H12DRAFT_1078581 [Mycena haematopus]